MRSVTFALAGLAVLVAVDTASACGRRKAARSRVVYTGPMPPTVVSHSSPAAAAPAAPASPAAAPSAPAATAPPAAAVEPRYAYDAEAGPYYYSYDENGKLIVRRWMDWVFRGGREAGMPRPPLPVVGWFTGR